MFFVVVVVIVVTPHFATFLPTVPLEYFADDRQYRHTGIQRKKKKNTKIGVPHHTSHTFDTDTVPVTVHR